MKDCTFQTSSKILKGQESNQTPAKHTSGSGTIYRILSIIGLLSRAPESSFYTLKITEEKPSMKTNMNVEINKIKKAIREFKKSGVNVFVLLKLKRSSLRGSFN